MILFEKVNVARIPKGHFDCSVFSAAPTPANAAC
jgi:hypothetical protein